MKILVVDNTRLFHQVIAKVFASAGLESVAADTGAAALAQIERDTFDVICSSYYLADTTGVDLCRRVRSHPGSRFVPFILFTAQQPVDVVREAYMAGVTDIFEKQGMDRLLTFIQRLLSQQDPISGRVLVVEDSPTLADIYAGTLKHYGLAVEVTATAEQALVRIAQEDFDMVLTDIVLSGPMSGITLVNQVRRLEGVRGEVPILAITAFDDPARRVELFRVGINDYVQKPVAEEELVARTRNLIAHFKLLRTAGVARLEAESQREDAYRELAYRASHDTLTNLGNRWSFEQDLGAVLADPQRAARHGVALIDIVSLRVVNDACGHEVGDVLLKEIGARIQKALPSAARAARLEGSRIGVIMPGLAAEAVSAAIGQIVEAIEEGEFFWSERHFAVRALAGAVPSLSGLTSITEAIGRAETANAAAHAAGANGLLIYDEADDRIAERQREKLALPALLSALDGNGFALFMQRIVPLAQAASNPTGGHEFLCRMIGRDGGLRLPGEFMPAAERYGLMPRLDRLVTRFALSWLAAHHQRHADNQFFTINLSGQTLSDIAFADFVRDELVRSGAPADKVYFEVTETAVLANIDVALSFMQKMRALGCRFALDDFGSGTASYSQLKNLPVQMLKIDGQFVRGMMNNPVDLAIIRSTCEVAKAMNLLTVAEFVESEAEAKQLAALGVDFGQGFGLGRPTPLPAAQAA
jgi:diguanylate cyclase (GGDEF)-like protein